jgi:Glutamate-1-semialdehyde aminotransferase
MNLIEKYISKTRKSKELFERAKSHFAGGINHNARFYKPYPIFVNKAKGNRIYDVDRNEYIDFWMGHASLILGHSPDFIMNEIKEQIYNGTIYGVPSEDAILLAEMIKKCVKSVEKIRFCNSGAEATMYAIRLARAFTKKRYVLKVRGGWHGYNTPLSRNVWETESLGILEEETKYTLPFTFNSIESFTKTFKLCKEDLACVILEPVLGAGGGIPATKDFLSVVREETEKVGAILIFDEIITGFRLGLGGAQEYYKIDVDLLTYGKIIGGGFPIGAVAGKSEILNLADPNRKNGVCKIGGGTFSANPVSMKAGYLTLKYLYENKDSIYDKINTLGNIARKSIDKILHEANINSQTTGIGSIVLTHFLNEEVDIVNSYEDALKCDKELQHLYYLYLMTEHNIFFLPGHIGTISNAHTDTDIQKLTSATLDFALNIKHILRTIS